MYKRLTKREAWEHLITGAPVYFLPSKVNPSSPFARPYKIKSKMSEEKFYNLLMKYQRTHCTRELGGSVICYKEV